MAFTAHVTCDLGDVVDYVFGSRFTPHGKPKRAKEFLVVRMYRTKRLRLYEDASTYSTRHGGQVLKKGKVVRRYDPDAGEQEGKPAEFTSLLDAAAYAARWL
jgi:hypothetical protein